MSGPDAEDITFTTDVTVPYDASVLFYENIPYDMLRTVHSNPQVLMTVDDLPVACREVDCDYLYIDTTPLVTGIAASNGNNAGDSMTISGSNFEDYVKLIEFADTTCTPSSVSSTSITCVFDEDLAAGEWTPTVTGYYGVYPTSGVTAHTVALTWDSVTPSSDLNSNGGTLMTLTGSGFPVDKDSLPSDWSLAFSDGADVSVECVLVTVTSTEITCRPAKFPIATFGTTMTFNMQMNSQSASQSVSIGTSDAVVDSISPTSMSPVLKADIVISVTASLTDTNGDPYALSAAAADGDLSVVLSSTTNSENDKTLNVFEADDAAGTITARFGGAWSGSYLVDVYSNAYGKFDSETYLDVSGTVTGISPLTGSIWGGTLITITGTNFDDDPFNNPVNLGWDHCEIISTSATEIVARTPLRTVGDAHDDEGSEDIIVALKTSEEATCDIDDGCGFVFDADLACTLDTMEVSYSTSDGYISIEFSGEGFGTDAPQVYLDGLEQEIVSHNDNDVVAKVTNINGMAVSTVLFYPASGACEGGHGTSSTDNAGLVLQAIDMSSHIDLLSVPSSGSAGGSTIVLEVAGVGPGAESSLQVLAGSDEICTEVTVPEYGKVVCAIGAASYSSQALAIKVGDVEYECLQGATTDACDYTTDENPEVTGVSPATTTVTLTGSGFSITNFD